MKYYGISDKGIVRKENQDCFSFDEIKSSESLLVAVCDGMGGHAAGSLASSLADDAFRKYVCSRLADKKEPDVDIIRILQGACTEANGIILRYSEMSEEYAGLGTTLVGGLLTESGTGSISVPLRTELLENLERGEQSILFLNRRGAHKLVTCGECGFVYKCPHCSVSLTYHSVNRRLICHYCGYTRRVDEVCPDCGGILKYIGAGTQLVEEELHSLFPGTEILRMDADVLSGSMTHEQVFERFRAENIPIMIGTQMVTKGLNFENVTLVGVLSADQSLYSGDFRAAERTFSLITQVIGRSGRGQKAGRAVIQTFTPSSEVIRQAARQDYDAFYQSEIILRKLQDSPPFSDLLSVTASGAEERAVVDACRFVKNRLCFLLGQKEKTEFLGPTPLTVVRVNNRFRYRIIIKCRSDSAIRNAVSGVITECSTDKRFRGISFYAG